MIAWRPRLMLAMAAVALLFAACSGSGSEPLGSGTTGPTKVPGAEELCPAIPRDACLLPGDTTNIFEVLSLDKVEALLVYHDADQNWVLGADVQPILERMDKQVTLEPWTLRQRPFFYFEPLWAPGEQPREPWILGILVDLEAGAMGLPLEGHEVQWPVPDGFVDEIMASYSDSTPTPLPADTPDPFATPYTPPTPPPTETPLPRSELYFDHPERELTWDGPDDAVVSIPRGHCGPDQDVREVYGVPAFIRVGERGFWYSSTSGFEATWHWTGYEYGDWQIWRGPSQESIYLVNTRKPGLAFEYRDYGCI